MSVKLWVLRSSCYYLQNCYNLVGNCLISTEHPTQRPWYHCHMMPLGPEFSPTNERVMLNSGLYVPQERNLRALFQAYFCMAVFFSRSGWTLLGAWGGNIPASVEESLTQHCRAQMRCEKVPPAMRVMLSVGSPAVLPNLMPQAVLLPSFLCGPRTCPGW